MRLKALLLDLDGTFLDTAPDMVAALDAVLENHGKPKSDYDSARNVVSRGSAGLLKVGFGITPEDASFESLKKEFLDTYENNICVKTEAFEGMMDVIEYCESKQIYWGICTNKPTYLTRLICDQLKLSERAAVVVCGDTLTVAKPHPAPLLHCTTIMKVAPSDCIYVGDDIRDMQASNAAGMHGAVANWGYIDADQEVEEWGSEFIVNQPKGLINLINDHI